MCLSSPHPLEYFSLWTRCLQPLAIRVRLTQPLSMSCDLIRMVNMKEEGVISRKIFFFSTDLWFSVCMRISEVLLFYVSNALVFLPCLSEFSISLLHERKTYLKKIVLYPRQKQNNSFLLCWFLVMKSWMTSYLSCSPAEVPDEEFIITCLLMVFVAVSIPKLARMDNTVSRRKRSGLIFPGLLKERLHFKKLISMWDGHFSWQLRFVISSMISTMLTAKFIILMIISVMIMQKNDYIEGITL